MLHTGYDLENKWTHIVDDIYEVVSAKLQDNSIDSEVKAVCIMTASDVVSVCHKLLGTTRVQSMVNLIFECMKRDTLQETALKGLTLIALHETSDLRAREEARMLGHSQNVGNLVPILNRQRTSDGKGGDKQSGQLQLARSKSVVQAAS